MLRVFEKVFYKFTRYNSTILFCDIRGFTQFFDQRPPDETFVFVTSVFERIVKIIEKQKGKVISFTGDGFLAQFGLGGEASDTPEINAIRSAIEIRDEVSKINLERHAEHNFSFSLGIGINTGLVAAGSVKYSDSIINLVLGDTVNTASRIESLAKFFSVDILISESTEEKVRGHFSLLPMPPKELRGKDGKCRTFWVGPTSKPMANKEIE